MDSNVLESQWNRIKGEVRSKWGKLTDDDVERIAGSKDKLVGAVQERYGYVWDEAQQMVDRYLDDYDSLKNRAIDAVSAVASKDNIQRLGNEVVQLVRRYPIPALLIGLSIGYFLARRPDRYWER
jgi:uncharacterized protein YjbJ (UPF0337 family)